MTGIAARSSRVSGVRLGDCDIADDELRRIVFASRNRADFAVIGYRRIGPAIGQIDEEVFIRWIERIVGGYRRLIQ